MGATSIHLLEPRISFAPYSFCAEPNGRTGKKKRRPKRLGNGNSVAPKKPVPSSFREMDDLCLVTLGGMGNLDAREEILKRHVMHTDHVSYEAACDTFSKIEETNYEWMRFMSLPFQIGIVTAFTAGIVSIPFVFYLPAVDYFNEHFVTADQPPLKELETALEVGSWSWNWMEPVLGTSTFVLLCLQYMRMHLDLLGVKPYTHQMKQIRAQRLAKAFPQYSKDLLISYSLSSPFYDAKKLWFPV
jgi:hypothetical protein